MTVSYLYIPGSSKEFDPHVPLRNVPHQASYPSGNNRAYRTIRTIPTAAGTRRLTFPYRRRNRETPLVDLNEYR